MAVVFGLPLVVAAIAAAAAGVWAGAAITGALVAVPAIVIGGHLRRSRIVVTPQEIAVEGVVVRRRVPRSRAARVVRADVAQPRVPIVDTVYVLDAAGDVLVRIHGHHHRRTDIDRLVAFLGVPSTAVPGPVTATRLDGLLPGIVPWREAHPFRFSADVAAGAVLAIVVAALVVALAMAPMSPS